MNGKIGSSTYNGIKYNGLIQNQEIRTILLMSTQRVFIGKTVLQNVIFLDIQCWIRLIKNSFLVVKIASEELRVNGFTTDANNTYQSEINHRSLKEYLKKEIYSFRYIDNLIVALVTYLGPRDGQA